MFSEQDENSDGPETSSPRAPRASQNKALPSHVSRTPGKPVLIIWVHSVPPPDHQCGSFQRLCILSARCASAVIRTERGGSITPLTEQQSEIRWRASRAGLVLDAYLATGWVNNELIRIIGRPVFFFPLSYFLTSNGAIISFYTGVQKWERVLWGGV